MNFIETLKDLLEGKTVTKVETTSYGEAGLCKITTEDGCFQIHANDLGEWIKIFKNNKYNYKYNNLYKCISEAGECFYEKYNYVNDAFDLFDKIKITLEENILYIECCDHEFIGKINKGWEKSVVNHKFGLDLIKYCIISGGFNRYLFKDPKDYGFDQFEGNLAVPADYLSEVQEES